VDKLDSRSDIAKKGADLIGEYREACKQAQKDHPKGGPRDHAYAISKGRCEDGLAKLGLSLLPNLPDSTEAAMRAAYKKFLYEG
jgi:hypothetical protein